MGHVSKNDLSGLEEEETREEGVENVRFRGNVSAIWDCGHCEDGPQGERVDEGYWKAILLDFGSILVGGPPQPPWKLFLSSMYVLWLVERQVQAAWNTLVVGYTFSLARKGARL
jgi:hypothetical protein